MGALGTGYIAKSASHYYLILVQTAEKQGASPTAAQGFIGITIPTMSNNSRPADFQVADTMINILKNNNINVIDSYVVYGGWCSTGGSTAGGEARSCIYAVTVEGGPERSVAIRYREWEPEGDITLYIAYTGGAGSRGAPQEMRVIIREGSYIVESVSQALSNITRYPGLAGLVVNKGVRLFLNTSVAYRIGAQGFKGGLIAVAVEDPGSARAIVDALNSTARGLGWSLTYTVIGPGKLREDTVSMLRFYSGLGQAGAVSVLLVPAAAGLAVAAWGSTKEIESVSTILESRGRRKTLAWAPIVLLPLLAVALTLAVERVFPALRGLSSGAAIISGSYLLVIALQWLGGKLLSSYRGYGSVLGGLLLAGSVILYKTGLAGYLGLIAYSLAESIAGVAGARIISSMIGVAYYVVASRVIIMVAGLVGAYLAARRLLPALHRGLSDGPVKAVALSVLLAAAISPLVAPALVALSGSLEVGYGGNLKARLSPGVPPSVYREMASASGVRSAGAIMYVGTAAVPAGRALGIAYTVGCYGDDFLSYLKNNSRHSITALLLYSKLKDKPVILTSRMGQARGEIRLGSTVVDLSRAERLPPGLTIEGANVLVPCSIVDNRSGLRVIAIYALADRGVVGEWRRILAREAPSASMSVIDVIGEGVKSVEGGVVGSLLLGIVLAITGVIAVTLVLARMRSERAVEAALAIARARGLESPVGPLAPAIMFAAGLALYLAYVTYILLLPARLGYGLLSLAWYDLELASFLVVAFSPLGLLLVFARRIVRGEAG